MQKENKKFYQAKWFLWMWLILFPPVGIILLWVCHKEMKKNRRIILSVIFAIWFVILMAATNGGSSTTPPTDIDSPATTSSVEVEESSRSEESAPPKELTVQDVEDACFSFFSEVLINAYGEISRGVGQENGTIIDSAKYNEDSKNGDVTVSYVLEDEPNSGVNFSIVFTINDERVGVSEILVDGVKQDVPDDAKESVLIWLLLDANYQG